MDIKNHTTKHRTITDSHNGSNNKQKVNNNRTTALEWTAAQATGGLNAFYRYQIFALDSAIVEVQEMFSCEAARSSLKSAQSKMKLRYNENAQDRSFEPGDKVLSLLPIPGEPLQARYYGPNTVDKKLSDVNYIVNTPGRCKQKQLCHTSMLKKYIDRDSSVISSVNLVNSVPLEQNQMDSKDMNFVKSDPASSKLENSYILKDFDQKLCLLSSDKRLELKQLILKYEH